MAKPKIIEWNGAKILIDRGVVFVKCFGIRVTKSGVRKNDFIWIPVKEHMLEPSLLRYLKENKYLL